MQGGMWGRRHQGEARTTPQTRLAIPEEVRSQS
eukprot:CAMPEP_0196579974 /NCGR_PEP_ID=MMETSP1081-20130531/26037_1 /TAXON_ID=36882 /ORGANISM="Pyramimonas amylifera, Strain CCMP720" /LENGTH=32 /DNA_ID= /DNA_START= /DNA_END= /DNA_ORIENTATION=